MSVREAAGGAVAVSGSIGFVGLVVPHLTRRLVGAAHRRVVPTGALLGALVVVRRHPRPPALAPREVPTGVLSALLGTPLLMALVRRRPQLPEWLHPTILTVLTWGDRHERRDGGPRPTITAAVGRGASSGPVGGRDR